MLYYNKINVSKRIDLVKSKNSNECMICHYWFFKHGFKFQDSVCKGWHELTISNFNISDIAIITIKMLIIVALFITLANLNQLIY